MKCSNRSLSCNHLNCWRFLRGLNTSLSHSRLTGLTIFHRSCKKLVHSASIKPVEFYINIPKKRQQEGRHYLFYVFIYLTFIKYLQWTRNGNDTLLFKKFKTEKYGPRWKVTKSSQKGLKSLTPKVLLCSSAEDQNSQNQGKPQDGEAPANTQGRSLWIQPGTEQTMAQAMISCSRAWEHVSILVGSPSLPSNLVLNSWLLSLFPG